MIVRADILVLVGSICVFFDEDLDSTSDGLKCSFETAFALGAECLLFGLCIYHIILIVLNVVRRLSVSLLTQIKA